MSSSTVIFVVLCFAVHGSYANSGPTLVNETGTINWGNDFFEEESSEGQDLATEYDAKGLQPWYDFVNSFIGTVINKEPYDVIIKAKTADSITSDFIKDEVALGIGLGVAICVTIGILFCIIMPIVGFIFCCCRCCGNCGGEMSQKDSPNNNCKRAVFGVILFMITLLMFTGVLLTFVCNDQMSDTVDNLKSNTDRILNETIKFVNRTIGEAEKLLSADFPFVADAISDDITDNKIKELVGDPLLKELNSVVKEPIDKVKNLSQETTRMQTQLEAISNNSAELKNLTVELQEGLNRTRKNLTDIQTECNRNFSGQSFCNSVDTSDLRTDADFTDLPDVGEELENIQDIVSNDFEQSAEDGLKEALDIPQTIINDTEGTRADIREMISNASDTVKDFEKDLRKTANDDVISRLVEFKDDQFLYYEGHAKKFDNYRWIAGVALTCMLLLIVVLMFLGLMCGICGYDKDATPTTRSSMSNLGGISLMAATGFCFVFASLLMLLTTICFVIGAPTQTLCKSLQSGDLFKEVLDNRAFWSGSYILSEAIFNKPDVPLTIGGFISDCRKNKPLYQAALIEHAFNVSEEFDIKKLLGNDTTERFEDLKVNLSDKTILTQETRESLNDLIDSGVNNISFGSFLNETKKSITAVNLQAFADNVTKLAEEFQKFGDNSTVPEPQRTKAYELGNDSLAVAEELRRLDRVVVSDMRNKSDELELNVEGLKAIGGNIQVLANETLIEAEAAQTYLQTNASFEIDKIVTGYIDRVLGYGYQFRDHVLDVFENRMAKCKPITNIYDAAVVMVCNEALYPFNGFWFSIGWCLFFFIPAIIFSVKLAKHYRRMDYESDFDQEFEPEMHEMSHVGNSNYPSNKKGFSNGVHPQYGRQNAF